jgi:hypothetical protein
MNDQHEYQNKKLGDLQAEFYSPESLQQTISDFSMYLTGSLKTNGHVTFVALAIDPVFASQSRRVVQEFLNYALDLTMRERFGAAGTV